MQVNGITVILDLDKFKEITKSMGWTEYKPNIITGSLTHLVEEVVSRLRGVVIYGLDEERGTEEAIIKFVEADEEEVLKSLEKIRCEIERLGRESGSNATLSIGVYIGPITSLKPQSPSEAKKTPEVIMALRALKKAKKMGGNRVIVL
ncbi:MAG: nucleotidyl cyclase domain-containing protein [Candidatus Nezhaarchaeales archaeon]